MHKIMIGNYTSFFHDGAIIKIEHIDNSIEFSMQSGEMHEEDLKDKIELSKYKRIKGKLHIEKIKKISINGINFPGKLKMHYDKGSIFDFILIKNIVELQIAWGNFPPNPDVNEFSTIEIEAEKIWWENIPDLYDPFW